MLVSIIVIRDRCVAVVEIPVFGTTSGSCDVVWKFDNVVFAIMDDEYSSMALYVVLIE